MKKIIDAILKILLQDILVLSVSYNNMVYFSWPILRIEGVVHTAKK